MASGNTLLQLFPQSNEPTSTIFATLDLRNLHPVLDFDGTTDEEAVFTAILPAHYAGGGVNVKLFVGFTSATTGTSRWHTSFELIDLSSLDVDADSFATANSGGVAAPGTSGQIVTATIAHTTGAQMDSTTTGEMFRLKVRRDADGTSGTDDITSDAELYGIELTEI